MPYRKTVSDASLLCFVLAGCKFAKPYRKLDMDYFFMNLTNFRLNLCFATATRLEIKIKTYLKRTKVVIIKPIGVFI